mgnify:CR=1 FL=1
MTNAIRNSTAIVAVAALLGGCAGLNQTQRGAVIGAAAGGAVGAAVGSATGSTARGAIETRALVTKRLRPLRLEGRQIYQIGMPWHFGWEGVATGDIANVLTAAVGDPNTSMHENKTLTCAIRAGRLKERRPA